MQCQLIASCLVELTNIYICINWNGKRKTWNKTYSSILVLRASRTRRRNCWSDLSRHRSLAACGTASSTRMSPRAWDPSVVCPKFKVTLANVAKFALAYSSSTTHVVHIHEESTGIYFLLYSRDCFVIETHKFQRTSCNRMQAQSIFGDYYFLFVDDKICHTHTLEINFCALNTLRDYFDKTAKSLETLKNPAQKRWNLIIEIPVSS